jgi:iron-regulated transporter 1
MRELCLITVDLCYAAGLWVADLAITQLFLEAVAEKERGVVNGVQNSLNMLMDVLKFALVVAVPETETFGFLIIISFAFIFLGWLLYAIFLKRERGHFFHCWTSRIAQPTFVTH